MASIWLDWREAQGGDLPMVCATCGDDATDLIERRLSTVRPGLLCIVRTRVTVLVLWPVAVCSRAGVDYTAVSFHPDRLTENAVGRDVPDFQAHPPGALEVCRDAEHSA